MTTVMPSGHLAAILYIFDNCITNWSKWSCFVWYSKEKNPSYK